MITLMRYSGCAEQIQSSFLARITAISVASFNFQMGAQSGCAEQIQWKLLTLISEF